MSDKPLTGTIYVDASGQIAGRFCSKVAKLLLNGKRVVVLNSERALVSGGRVSVRQEWTERLGLYSHVNPLYGPIHYRRPDNILRRMVRGMVPHQENKGRMAMKRLRVYMGVPTAYREVELTKFDDTAAPRPLPLYTTMAEVASDLGWSGR